MDADDGLDDVRFAVVDIETSGLRPSRDRILQMAVVTVDARGQEHDHWSSFVRLPPWPVGRLGPRRVHGITRSQLRHAPPLGPALAELARRIDGSVLTAHNLQFDLGFLAHQARRTRVSLPDTPELCTLMVSRSLDPGYARSHRLVDLCQRYGVALDRPHDALADARATGAVLPFLLDDAEINSWGQLTARRPARPSRPR